MTEHVGFDLKVFGPFGAMFEPFLLGLDATRKNGERASEYGLQGVATQMNQSVKALARCQIETLGLMNRRAQAYIEVPSRLAQCRTPQDVLSEQASFWRVAFEQYAETSSKVLSIWSDAVPMPLFRSDAKVDRDYINFSQPSEEAGQAPRNGAARPHQQRRVA